MECGPTGRQRVSLWAADFFPMESWLGVQQFRTSIETDSNPCRQPSFHTPFLTLQPVLETPLVQSINFARFNDANNDQLRHEQCFQGWCGCFTWLVTAEVKSQDGKEYILTRILTFQKCACRTPSSSSFLLEIC